MKVRIKDCYGNLIDLTKGRIYEVISQYCEGEAGYIIDDAGDKIYILYEDCAHLNGGSWEIIKENKTMNREEAIRAMLDGKKVKVADGSCGYGYYNGEKFMWNFPERVDEPFKEVWKYNEWEIVPELKKRPMTRNEVLGFLANTSGIVVRYRSDKWENVGKYSFDGDMPEYEYAYIDSKGNIGEPMKFEVEE